VILDVQQQFSPGLSGLPIAFGNRNQFLLAVFGGAHEHQDTLLVIDDPAQYAQNLGYPPIAIAAVFVLAGLFAYSFDQELVLLRHLQFVTPCIAVLSKGFTRLTFTDSQLLDDLFDGPSARSRVHQFFDATSLRMAFSRA